MAKRVVTLVAVVAACGLPLSAMAVTGTPSLLGVWQCQGKPVAATLQFKPHHNLLYNGIMSRYSLLPGVIMIRDAFGPVEYRYQLDGDRLRINSPAGADLQCLRGAAARSGATASAVDAALAQLHARLCSWSGPSSYSGSYSHSSWLQFDGAGRLRYGSDSVFASGANLAQGGNDNSVGGSYRVVGNRVEITLDDGTRTDGIVRKRERDGAVTELTINDNLFAAGECQ